MEDFFSDLDDEPEDDLPDWVQSIGADEEEDELDAFDQLRQKSARAGASQEEMEGFDDEEEEEASPRSRGGGFSLGSFTAGQRLTLMILLFLNVIVIVLGLLVVTQGWSL